MNLDAYLERIGYDGPAGPTLDALHGVVSAHACAIPFENLDVLGGRGVSLDDGDVERKLVRCRRGGYCFEQNSLLLRALAALGFEAAPISARVRVGASREFVPPRTHLMVRVDLGGVPWLADVGVGGLTPTAPLRLDLLGEEQTTPHEPRRVVREDRPPFPVYSHQARLGGDWADVCEFTLEGMPPIDREVGNWWASTNPRSKFRRNLMVALAGPDGTRASVLNREFTHRRGSEVLERFELADADHLRAVLAQRFGLELSAEEVPGLPPRDGG